MPAFAARVSSGNAAANFSCSISWLPRRRDAAGEPNPIILSINMNLTAQSTAERRCRATSPLRLAHRLLRNWHHQPEEILQHSLLADLDVGGHRHARYHPKAGGHVMQRHAI